MKFKIAVALAAFIALWLGHREYQIHTTPPKIRPTFTAEQEAAALATFAEAEKAYEANPNPETNKAVMAAFHAYSIIDNSHPRDLGPYWERMPWQIHSANRALLHSGNVFRYVRWIRHAVFPWLDRPA